MDFLQQISDYRLGGLSQVNKTLEEERRLLEQQLHEVSQKEHLMQVWSWIENLENLRKNGFFLTHGVGCLLLYVQELEGEEDNNSDNFSIIVCDLLDGNHQVCTTTDAQRDTAFKQVFPPYCIIDADLLKNPAEGQIIDVNEKMAPKLLDYFLNSELKSMLLHATMSQDLSEKLPGHPTHQSRKAKL